MRYLGPDARVVAGRGLPAPLAARGRSVLLLVDYHFAHGNLRDRVSFTHSAAALCREHGRERLDAEIARNTSPCTAGGVRV